MIEVLHCPACGKARSALFEKREVHGFLLYNRMCRHCGLVYLSRRMEDEELHEFYRRGYRELNDGSEVPNERNLAEQRERAQHLAGTARQIAPQVRRHLDVGCSTGLLMAAVRDAYRCESVGIEPGIEHRAMAVAEGLQVYESLEELSASGPERFDLVTLSHVLEHLPDPAGTLRRIRKQLLSERGHVVIEVPNLYGHSCFEPAHLFSFSTKTLHDAVRLAGFEPVFTRLHGLPRSDWRPRYLLTVARPSNEAGVGPKRAWVGVRGATLRRRWGMRNSRGILQLARALGRRMQAIA